MPPMISGAVDTVEYRRRDNYVYRLTVGEHLLVSLHARKDEPLYALTPTGAELWERLAEWCTREQLAEALVGEYDVALDDASSTTLHGTKTETWTLTCTDELSPDASCSNSIEETFTLINACLAPCEIRDDGVNLTCKC